MNKNTKFCQTIRVALLASSLVVASCGSRRHAASTVVPPQQDGTVAVASADEEARQPAEAKRQEQTCVTARLRLELSAGTKDASVGGVLRMKRDDVIQISLVTFGILEVARIEMTPDYFMIIDKMGKRYVKSSYKDVAFLRNANVDFKAIQTYFWDEQTAVHLAWERSGFVTVDEFRLPTRHVITLPYKGKQAKAELTLSGLKSDSDWEKRTPVPTRYTQVSADELITRIMNLSL